jgi:hypothetical protein
MASLRKDHSPGSRRVSRNSGRPGASARWVIALAALVLSGSLSAAPPEPVGLTAKLRKSPALKPLVRDVQQGKLTGANLAERKALLGAYLTLWFGNPETKLKPGSMELLFSHFERNPELFERKLLPPVAVRFAAAEERALPEVLKARVSSVFQGGMKFVNPALQPAANAGYWKKRSAESLLTAELTAQLGDAARPASDRARALYLAAKDGGNGSIAVDAVQWAGLLDPKLREAIRGKSTASAQARALEDLLKIRDDLATSLGFAADSEANGASAFDKLRGHHGVTTPSGLSKATAVDELAREVRARSEKVKAEAAGETALVRQLSPLEAGFRSLVGGEDCSSRTYFDKALDPIFAYFTMTGTEDQVSTGNATVVFGKDETGARIAFLDKLQNVPENRARSFLEGVRRGLEGEGFTLVVPSELGDSDGLTLDPGLRAFVSTQVPLDRTRAAIRFLPESMTYAELLPNRHSRAYEKPSAFALLPFEIDTVKESASTSRAKSVETARAKSELESLKDGDWQDRRRYLVAQNWLLGTGFEDPELESRRNAWIADESAPFEVKKLILKQTHGQGLAVAGEYLAPSDFKRYVTSVLSSSLDRQEVVPAQAADLARASPDLLNPLAEPALAKVARYLFQTQGLDALDTLAAAPELSERARFILLSLLPNYGLPRARTVFGEGAALERYRAYLELKLAPPPAGLAPYPEAVAVFETLRHRLPRKGGLPALFDQAELDRNPTGLTTRLFQSVLGSIARLSGEIADRSRGVPGAESVRLLVRLAHGLKIRTSQATYSRIAPTIETALKALSASSAPSRAYLLRSDIFPPALREEALNKLDTAAQAIGKGATISFAAEGGSP